MEAVFAVSERRACQVVGISRTTKRRQPGGLRHVQVVARLHALSEQYPRFGYRKIFHRLQGEGWRVGREQVRLLRRREGLRVPQKPSKRRRPGISTVGIERAEHANHVWSYDFVADQTADGKTLRFLTVIDEFTREALWLEFGRRLNSVDVVRVLEHLVGLRGKPEVAQSDTGP